MTTVALENLPERFRSKVSVNESTGCWEWTAALTPKGYGKYKAPNGRMVRAHRYSFEEIVATIPDGLQLDHLCRVRSCVNPAHLEPVPCHVNVSRGVSANAAKTHCPAGHEYAAENTIWWRNKRQCRACKQEKLRERRARAKAA